jgi:3-oxoacyl-[acyl-carrier-protein] synthase-3
MIIKTYLPEKILSNQKLHEEFPDWDVNSFEKKIGIKQRHIVSENETALDLAVNAAKKALIGFEKSNIDFVLFCTQSPDYFLPTSACIIQDKLNLNKNCGALDFNLGCSGYVYGLSIVKGLLAASIANNVLFITAETYTKYINKEDRTNRSIFGDGAAATIITKEDAPKFGEFVLKTDGSGYEKLIVKNGASRYSFNEKAERKNYGSNNKFTDNNLYMDGPDIFNFTIENIPNLVNETLDKNKMHIDDVDFFIYHQANAFMLNFLRKRSKIPKDKFYINMQETANTVSATIPIALKDALDKNLVNPKDKILLAGFGVGLSMGATIITI